MTEPIDKILKDTDFENLERCIGIEMSQKRSLLNQIKKDIQFFGKHNIIDFSLILSVVDKSKIPEDYLKN